MRESRLAVSYAQEDRVLLENSDALPYPEEENLDQIFRYRVAKPKEYLLLILKF